MKVQFRKAQGVYSPNLFEWQAKGSKKWYRIYTENILCIEGHHAEENIVNLAENGETVLLEAFFLKDVKALLIKRKISSSKEQQKTNTRGQRSDVKVTEK